MKKHGHGRPSAKKTANPKFKGQYQPTMKPDEGAIRGKPRQVNFRCPLDTYKIIE